MPSPGEQYLKELESAFRTVHDKLREELQAIRGNRPSVEFIEGVRVNLYEEQLTVRQLGSLSVIPPRSIQITVWDKNAVAAVMKAIESSKAGLSLTNDGNNIIATLSQMGAERREELTKLVKKTSEAIRIQVRARRDEVIKKIKEAESAHSAGSGQEKRMSEDEVFKTKEKIQKLVDEVNGKIEALVQNKLKELGE